MMKICLGVIRFQIGGLFEEKKNWNYEKKIKDVFFILLLGFTALSSHMVDKEKATIDDPYLMNANMETLGKEMLAYLILRK